MVTRTEIVEAAYLTLGTPWIHEGRHVPRGLDCIGVILWVLRKIGYTDYEPPAYPRHAQFHQFAHEFSKHLIPIPLVDAGPGDFLVFRQERFPCHCGIISWPRPKTGETRFIHGPLNQKVIEEVYTDEWRRKTLAAYRLPGLED